MDPRERVTAARPPEAGARLQPRRLHIVHTEASTGWGGQEIRILTEAEGMQSRGHRVTLLCPDHATIHPEAKRRGLEVVALPIGRKKPGGVFALRRWLKRHPVDVINTHSSTDSWLAGLACRLLHDPPAIIRTRHISTAVRASRANRWLYLRSAARVVTTGEKLRVDLLQWLGADAGHIVSIPTGIDLQRFSPGDRTEARRTLALPESDALVGIVATLRSWKGHDDLLEAFAMMKRPGSRLVIVGDGPCNEPIRRRMRALGIDEQVVMAGNQDNVTPWIRAFDVFVLPSFANEGVPQALMQAMACGIPVVSTTVGSIPEIVTPERTGLLVPPKDPQALAAALTRVLDDDALRGRLAEAGYAYAQQHFGIDIMLDRMETLFRQARNRTAGATTEAGR